MFVPGKSFQPSLIMWPKNLLLISCVPLGYAPVLFMNSWTYSWTRLERVSSGLYYNHVTIVNYASSGVNQLRASLNDDTRVIIYDHHMFIVQATDANTLGLVISDEETSFITLAPRTNFVKLFYCC